MQDNKNDQLIEIPDFRIFLDFVNWTENLGEKEIQSWRAKDWNKMYEKLRQCIYQDPYIEKEIPEFLKSGKYFKRTDLNVENLSADAIATAKIQIFMRDPRVALAMGKLYANYHIEPDQLNKIYELSQEAGKEASTGGKGGGSNLISWDTNLTEGNTKWIDLIVSKQTSYPEVFEQMGGSEYQLLSDISLVEKDDCTLGTTGNSEGKAKIKITKIEDGEDMPWDTLFHEAAHAHLQTTKSKYREELAKLKPVKDFDDDLVQLLDNNHDFYLSFENYRSSLKFFPIVSKETLLVYSGKISDKLAKKMQSPYKVYRQQPREYFAFFYGYMAERSFRRNSGQYSERYIKEQEKYLKQIGLDLTKLLSDTDGNTIFIAPKFIQDEYTEDKHREEFLKYLFTGKDNPLDGKIKIKEEERHLRISISSSGFIMQKAWQEWEKKIWQPLIEKQSNILNYLDQIGMHIPNMQRRLLTDEKGNIRIYMSGHPNSWENKGVLKGLEYLFTGKDNPLNGKIEVQTSNVKGCLIIPTNEDTQRAWQEWDKKIWRPMQSKIGDFAKAFTSKNEFKITILDGGKAKINFSKRLPYNSEDLLSRIYNSHNLKDRLKIKLMAIDNIEISDNSIITPPVYSKEFDQLLSLFKKDKIGFCEAEQKRDAIRRYRRMKTNKIIQNFKSIFSGRH